jgi:hypothetical protein
MSPPAPAEPAPEPGKTNLHPALITEEGIGEVVVYVSDDFRRSAPMAAEPLDVITLQRTNPGDALNSPMEDMSGLHRYMQSNDSVFRAQDLVAIASSRDLIRIFLRGEHRALAESFKYPRATFARAAPAYWARLRSIAIPDFSRFIVKQAARQAEAERWLFGARIPAVEGRRLDFRLKIEAASADKGRALASALERWRSDALQFKVIPGRMRTSSSFRRRSPFPNRPSSG